MPRRSKEITRKLKRNQRKRDKELSSRFDNESNPSETFTTFRARMRKPKF